MVLIIGGFVLLNIPSIFAEEYDVGTYLPVRDDIGTEWKFPSTKSVYDEMNGQYQLSPADSFPSEYVWQGHMKGSGFGTNFLDLYIYGFDSSKNANNFYNRHVEYWENRGGYQEWSPNSISNADECYGRITTGSVTDKVSLYCVKDSIVIFVLSAGFEFEMKDEVTKFANAVINKIDDDKVSKVNDELNAELFSFVDPQKDPQHYIDRYNNEPIYKEWFDTNYSGYTIEEAVGLESKQTVSDPNMLSENYIIPKWVKGVFAFYVDGGIGDDELIEALQFLVKEGILRP